MDRATVFMLDGLPQIVGKFARHGIVPVADGCR
jgi:hypothetical protein